MSKWYLYQNLHPRWQTMEVGGFPRVKVGLLNTSKKRCFFALSEVSFLQLSKIVTDMSLWLNILLNWLWMKLNLLCFWKLYYPVRSKYKNLSFWRVKILARRQHNQFLRQRKIGSLPGVAPCIILYIMYMDWYYKL